MKQQLCANCNERPPFFRVRGGPIKRDSKHSLCMACYRDQQNSMHAQTRKPKTVNCTCKQFGNGVDCEEDPPAAGRLWDPKHQKVSSTMEKIFPWNERHSVLNKLLVEKEVIFQGIDLPDPEDPSDPQFVSMIYISSTGAGTETIFGDKVVGTGIPSLMVPNWNKDTMSYLKHWLFKVFDDPLIYRANEIHVLTTREWQRNFLSWRRGEKL